MMNMIRDKYLKMINDETVPGTRFFQTIEVQSPVSTIKTDTNNDGKFDSTQRKRTTTSQKQLLYTVMERANQGTVRLDNIGTHLALKYGNGRPLYPRFRIGVELALKMKWIVGNANDRYRLGQNLRKDFPTGVVPDNKTLDGKIPHYKFTRPKGYVNGDEIFFYVDNDTLHLSCFIDWVFMNVDQAFEEAFGKETLYLFGDLPQSTTVGDKMEPLLAVLPSQTRYELKQRQYISLRVNVIDIIELYFKDDSDNPIKFQPGNTTVTLHFKQYGQPLHHGGQSHEHPRVSWQLLQSLPESPPTHDSVGGEWMDGGIE